MEYFRNTGYHEVANIFATLYESFTDDIQYDQHGADVERSIINYYLADPNAKKTGLKICDKLSLDPGLDHGRRNMCRNNLLWYTTAITDYVKVNFRQLDIKNTDGYIQLNPSVAKWNDSLWMIQRTVNYELNSDGNYVPVVDDNIRTRNWLCELDNDYNIIQARVIEHPDDWPDAKYGLVLGFEDSRLFVHNNQLWTSSTVRELESDGIAQIVVARLDISESGIKYTNWKAITPTYTKHKHYEKNWMPITDQKELCWVYSSDPIRVVNDQGETIMYTGHPVTADHWRGGSQVIPFKLGWLYCIHETIIPNYKDRTYLHRFVWLDKDWKVSMISPPFFLKARGIEFVCGLAQNNDNLVLSFGFKDKESWLAEINADDVWDMLVPVNNPKDFVINNASTVATVDIGKALLTNQQVAVSSHLLSQAGLPRHHDNPKNWDNLMSMYQCLTTCDPGSPVLDVGATQESAFLPGLYRCRYNDLVSLNLSQIEDELIGGVLYRNGDITNTVYPDNHFGFVACLSVIEHGIDQDLFFKEVFRIMKPGSRLAISTDYWSTTVDTAGLQMFGTDMIIFTPTDVEKMISIAEQHGFKHVGKFDPATKDPVILNMGVEYTFVMILFEKPEA